MGNIMVLRQSCDATSLGYITKPLEVCEVRSRAICPGVTVGQYCIPGSEMHAELDIANCAITPVESGEGRVGHNWSSQLDEWAVSERRRHAKHALNTPHILSVKYRHAR